MKRKLALLLAAVMAVTAFPMTAMAASENSVTRQAVKSGDEVVLIEEGTDNLDGVSGDDWSRIGYFKIVLKETVTDGDKFGIRLENAEFNFQGSTVKYVEQPAEVITDANKDNFGVTSTIPAAGSGIPKATLDNALKAIEDEFDMTDARFVKVEHDATLNETDPANPVYDGLTAIEVTYSLKTVVEDEGKEIKDSGAITTYNTNKGTYNPDTRVYTRKGEAVAGDIIDAKYELEIGSSLTNATVTMKETAKAGSVILIPIVVILDGDEDEYRIRVSDSGNTTISETSHVFASKADGKTKTYVKDTVTARSQFELKRIIIEEQKLGSIKEGKFYLNAPKGYEFTSVGNIEVGREPGLGGTIVKDSNTVKYDDRRGKVDYTTLLFDIRGITPSTDIKGALYIDNVVLVAEDEETIKTGDVNLTIDNYGSSTIYTEESFKVATASDYTIELKRTKDAIPTLVSGRLEGNVKYANDSKAFSGMTDNIDDEFHKAARVKVAEKIPAAWWAERTTKLTLPEDVTILKAKFDKITNLDDSKTELQAGTTDKADSIYYNTQKKVGKVTVDDNELTITNLKINADKKASFELDLWLGMAVNFEGDIDLTLSGSAVEKSTDGDYPKVTIAKAIKPVEVNVDKVSEVQVGYQYFTVSDFSITETAAGNLLKGKEVRVSITDGISIDMEIAKGFTAKVTEGDLKISNVTTSSVLSTRPNATTKTEGQITFEIDRESDEASTISFTNVQVKVSRNVPYSNLSASDDRGIDLVVWGNAIAANYYQLDENDGLVNQNDLFTVPGVSAKYINVVTVANDASSEFKNVVQVTIGNPVIKINDQDFTMPVAAYVSTASNSTMVPVRFVANALGLADETVKWDDANKTVTVDAGTRIVQFQIGNTNYLVNGVSVPMVSPDGLPVAAEITSERAFIPFRALGEAFNVTVGWDAATSTATYNAADKK